MKHVMATQVGIPIGCLELGLRWEDTCGRLGKQLLHVCRPVHGEAVPHFYYTLRKSAVGELWLIVPTDDAVVERCLQDVRNFVPYMRWYPQPFVYLLKNHLGQQNKKAWWLVRTQDLFQVAGMPRAFYRKGRP